MRERLKRVIRTSARTAAGRNVLLSATVGDPRQLTFAKARWWPEEIRGFEDLAFLFSSNQLNHAIISQELDEASLPEGGMGIHIAKTMLDEVTYEPGPPNKWRLCKRLDAPRAASAGQGRS